MPDMKTKNAGATGEKPKGRPRSFDRDWALLRALDIFWRKGFEPASVAELCAAMEINPPSLYSAFGNKAKLFLEAVSYYERVYWKATWERLEEEPDITRAIDKFFSEAADILLSPSAPCGCMVVLAAINVSQESADVVEAVSILRQEGKDLFEKRLCRAVHEEQLPADTGTAALATALNTLLEGMSIEAKDGATLESLRATGQYASRLLPCRKQ
ncbi:TPA: TetR/AcrR family transcriptional regulator [Klebsiella aerogenes]|nr:TetR/AcrR family transcriptional regulator [Klebsiella aerogenes]HDS6534000.1 TetR/AcrR family transcriptional regulator [Klebsiella aerogenes]HDS7213541.1 TetR/AcrR family transcriptional regulator [Klebsiella aerogenes]HDT0788425.1 TetR/AcrR family transcriptional regulator [Klebsiella aerogenes]HDT1125528.1 TetR/AcrR family transcriptional regulator [Klebsiella aerogenes]